jgi:hypothetical protein
MNLKQYNALIGDTKLAAALAIAMGWRCSLAYSITKGAKCIFVEDPNIDGWACKKFDPFADASIPYGLLQEGAIEYCERMIGGDWQANIADYSFTNPAYRRSSKTHAIVQAYIAADPMGHLAKFLSLTHEIQQQK